MGVVRTATGERSPFAWPLAILAMITVLPGCAGLESPDAASSSASVGGTEREGTPSPPRETIRDGRYDWAQMPIGAGGFVTGIVSTPNGAATALYARTDVGGAYRWNGDGQLWEQMLRAGRFPDGDLTSGDYTVRSIAVAPQNPAIVYLAVGNDYNPASPQDALSSTGRILRSDDGGETWTSSAHRWFVAGNQRSRTGSEQVAVDPTDADHVVFGTQREGLWESFDGSATWRQVPLDVVPAGTGDDETADQAGVSFVSASISPVGSATFYAGVANTGVFVRAGSDPAWREIVDLAEGEVPSSASLIDDQLVFAVNTLDGSPGRLVRVAADLTTTTIDTPAESDTWNLAVDPFDPDHFVLTDDAVRSGHLWTSNDAGSSWREHDIAIDAADIPWLEQTDLASFMSVGRLMFDPTRQGRVWFAEGMGVWTSDDVDEGTVVWEARARGIEELVVSGIVTRPDAAPIVTVADRQGFVLDRVDRYPSATLVDDRFASGSGLDYSSGSPDAVAWVGAESNIGSSPERTPRGAVSRDGGETWTEMEGLDPEMFGGEVAVSATDPETVVWQPTYYSDPTAYQHSPVALRVSHDGGESWDKVTVDGDTHSFHRLFWWFTRRALAADRVNGDFYLLSDEERFYVSTDGARSWQRARHAPPCSDSANCHVFGQLQPDLDTSGSLWASTGSNGLYRSLDAGASPWTKIDGLDEAGAFAFGAPAPGSDDRTIFVVGRAAGDDRVGILRSTDDGHSWVVLSYYPNDSAMGINALAADLEVPGRVYVGFTGGGVVVGDDPAY